MDGQALYYGMNALSNNVIMADRKKLKSANGMYLGSTGSGKSFAAKRELSEECGLTTDNFIDLGVVYATVGYDSEKIYLWAATGLHSTAQHLDAGEFLDVVKMPFDEALGLVMDGTIKDSKTQVALLKYAQLRAKS